MIQAIAGAGTCPEIFRPAGVIEGFDATVNRTHVHTGRNVCGMKEIFFEDRDPWRPNYFTDEIAIDMPRAWNHVIIKTAAEAQGSFNIKDSADSAPSGRIAEAV